MSLALAVADVLSARLNYSHAASVAFNQLYYRVASVTGAPPIMATALADVATDLYNGLSNMWKNCASEEVTMTGVTVVDVSPSPRSVGVTHAPLTPVVGLVTGDALPMQDCPTILKRTNVGQRWGLGRLYVVGIAESSQEAGRVDAAVQLDLALFASLLSQTVTITGIGWGCTISPILVTLGVGGAVTRTTDIVSCQLSDDVLKTQRRRRPGKGI